MKKLLSFIITISLILCVCSCGTQKQNEDGSIVEAEEPTTTSTSTEEKTEPSSTNFDASNMTDEELFEYLNDKYGTFNAAIPDDDSSITMMYWFQLKSGKRIARFDDKQIGSYYACIDLENDVGAFLDEEYDNSYLSDDAVALYDFFIDWCKEIGITPDQMISVIDYYAAFVKQDYQTNPTEETMSIGQKNALQSAKNYLSFSHFSYEGLISQLEFEKYSHEEAVFAADNCGADWNEQALKSAKSYLSFSHFSYTGLIEQLEFEKFTTEQAKYGADNCGADWYEQAAKSAKSYLEFSQFSRDGLIDQLVFEGFTYEQAVYGVEANGY